MYASCFDANAGIFETLLGSEDAVVSDELNHASIIDGIRLCKAQKHRYLHRNLEGIAVLVVLHIIFDNLHIDCETYLTGYTVDWVNYACTKDRIYQDSKALIFTQRFWGKGKC